MAAFHFAIRQTGETCAPGADDFPFFLNESAIEAFSTPDPHYNILICKSKEFIDNFSYKR